MVVSDSLAVRAGLKSRRGNTRLISEMVQKAEGRHLSVYIPGHQGHDEGNKMAGQLAKAAATAGLEVEDVLLRWRTPKRLSGRGGGGAGAIGCFSCCQDIATWRGICTAGGSETGRSVTTVGEGRKRTWSIICFTANDWGRRGKR